MEFKGNQNKVIEYGKGTLLVEAGPGSGKTTVIVERIKHLIRQGVDPESFLVITFTNKAADNLKYKLRKELSNEIVLKMQISTIHSFCLELLKSRDIQVKLIDDDSSERKTLFIKKFSEELGFIGESTVLDYQIPAVISKFGEYGSFNVDSKMLEEMISDSRPVSQSYINFVNSMKFFSKKLIEDYDKTIKKDEDFNSKSYKKNWYNARFRQIVRAYPIYLKLLDENGYVDYDTLQKKTMEELGRDSKTQYTTVFVDEFQDTDPLQFRIFQHLREHCDYFTAVGDVDQHIYAFRSSFNDFFDELVKLEGHETIPLDINFRSSENIVTLTEEFISPQRKDTSNKNMKSDGKPYNNPNFLIENEDSDEEALNIYQIIKYLKENHLIRDYSDVAILYRRHSDKTIKNLTEMLSNDNINFSIKGQKDLSDKPWVKSIKTLLWYVSRKTYLGHIPSRGELEEELKINAFCGDYFETPFWNLDQSTIDYLHSLQENFNGDILSIENKLRKENGGRKVSNPGNVRRNEDLDTLIKIFSQVQVPIIDLEKIENPKDKEFFSQLERIREEICPKKPESTEDNAKLLSNESENLKLISDNSSAEMEADSQEESEPLTVLAIFYKLLALSDIYDYEMSYEEIADIALLTQIISNYESFISDTDIRGAFFFLKDAIDKYDSYHKDDGGVQLMTIHGAKGLEFPVTIITSLQEENFPMKVKDPNREKDNISRNDTYYTPNECLEYKTALKKENGEWVHKTISIEEENILSAEEEDRVLYVAMTRAKDLLILSTIGKVPEQIEGIKDSLTDFGYDELDKVKFEWDFKESHPIEEDEEIKDDLESLEEPVVLNYSRYTQYISCPFKYDLSYNLGFMRSGSAKAANRGSVFHEIMEELNLKLLDGIIVNKDELEEIIIKHYKPMFDIEEGDEEFKEFKNNVINYYYKYSVNREVLEAEYDFELLRDNYLLNGAIDLVYREEDGEVVILDYKYAEFDENHIDAYVKQSYIYASALREIPEYEKYDVKRAIIHFVKGDKPYVVDIDEDRMNDEKANLNVIAGKIKNDEYERKPEKAEECSRCSYRYFCKPKEYASQLYE